MADFDKEERRDRLPVTRRMKLLSFFAALLIRTLYLVTRVRHVRQQNIDGVPQYILTFWHAHLLLMLHSRYRQPIMGLISQSKDGEIIARVMERYGVEAARGSSTRGGGAALRELIRAAREGRNLAFTPDGPKGPPRIAKDGVIYAARATGLPVLPVAFAAKKKSRFAPGIGWSSRSLSRKPSFCMDLRSRFHETATSRSGGCAWRTPSTASPRRPRRTSMFCGRNRRYIPGADLTREHCGEYR